MTNDAVAVGTVGVKLPPALAAGVMLKLPDAGTLTVTIAKRMEPSGHVFLTSVCVGRLPTCSAPVAAPCGSAWPNVAQPGPRPTVATAAGCACTGAATGGGAWPTVPQPGPGPTVATAAGCACTGAATATSSASAARSAHTGRIARFIAFSIGGHSIREPRRTGRPGAANRAHDHSKIAAQKCKDTATAWRFPYA